MRCRHAASDAVCKDARGTRGGTNRRGKRRLKSGRVGCPEGGVKLAGRMGCAREATDAAGDTRVGGKRRRLARRRVGILALATGDAALRAPHPTTVARARQRLRARMGKATAGSGRGSGVRQGSTVSPYRRAGGQCVGGRSVRRVRSRVISTERAVASGAGSVTASGWPSPSGSNAPTIVSGPFICAETKNDPAQR
jgi:hypothetical protein